MIIRAVVFYFIFGGVLRFIGREQRVIKSAGTVDSTEISIIYVTPQKYWCTWIDQVATVLTYSEVRFSLINNVSSKHKNKRKKSWGIKGYQKCICCRNQFILMQRPYQHIFSLGKEEMYLVPLLLNQIGLGTQLRRTRKWRVLNNFMFQVIFWKFLCRQGITGELLGNYWENF